METVRRSLRRLARWEYSWPCLLVLVTLILHFAVINNPSGLVLDEQHYITDARSIIAGKGTLRFEHPPLGKLFIAAGVFLLGDNPVGWRFFSVIFGAISVILFYLICRQLGMSKRTLYLATFLMTFENLSFVQASVAMLDVFSLTFALAAFWFYLKKQYPASGLMIALSTLAKLNGALTAVVIGLHWLLARRRGFWHFAASMALAPLSFILALPFSDYLTYGRMLNPFEEIKTMLNLSSGLTFATTNHPSLSRPWEWVLLPEIMPYWYQPRYMAAISFSLWALIIPAVIFMAYRAVKGNPAALFGITWFTGTYLVWIPISIITDRISFVYYFYPAVGVVCIGLALLLSTLMALGKASEGKSRRIILIPVWGFLVLHLGFFLGMGPLLPW